jgi:hypothetical protein
MLRGAVGLPDVNKNVSPPVTIFFNQTRKNLQRKSGAKSVHKRGWWV